MVYRVKCFWQINKYSSTVWFLSKALTILFNTSVFAATVLHPALKPDCVSVEMLWSARKLTVYLGIQHFSTKVVFEYLNNDLFGLHLLLELPQEIISAEHPVAVRTCIKKVPMKQTKSCLFFMLSSSWSSFLFHAPISWSYFSFLCWETVLFNHSLNTLAGTAEFQSEPVTQRNFIAVVMPYLLLSMSLNFICFLLFLLSFRGKIIECTAFPFH